MKKLTILVLASSITLLFTACKNDQEKDAENNAAYKEIACKRLVDLSPNEINRANEFKSAKMARDQVKMNDMNQEQLRQFLLRDKEDMACK